MIMMQKYLFLTDSEFCASFCSLSSLSSFDRWIIMMEYWLQFTKKYGKTSSKFWSTQYLLFISQFALKLSHWPGIQTDNRFCSIGSEKKNRDAYEKLCHFITYFDLLRFAATFQTTRSGFVLTLDKSGQYICWLLHVKYPVCRTHSPDTDFAALA